MNTRPASLALAAVLMCSASSTAEIRRQAERSKIDSEPDVVYTEEFSDKKIELLVVKPGYVFESKKGGRKRGALRVDTKVELIGFTERAFKVRGTLEGGGGVSGWVSPKALASKDKKFIENFKKLFHRQLEVRQLIENQEVAIGMTADEVASSLGKPTKTKVRRDAKGVKQTWEFVVYEEVKHYATLRDPYTGALYRQYTHTTQEEKSKVVVEFEDEIATAIEESENNGGGKVKIIAAPVIFAW